MAPPQTPPTPPPNGLPRVRPPRPRDDDDRSEPSRPDTHLSPEMQLQRWLDLSG